MTSGLDIKDKSENSPYLKASAFRKNTRRTEPHKHNSYFEMVFLSVGRGFHTIDNQCYEVRPPVLFFIRQDQVHHWNLEEGEEPDGYVLILKKAFLERSLDGELKELLDKISRHSCAYLEESGIVGQLLSLIVQETARDGGGSFTFIEGTMKGLFVKVLEATRPSAGGRRQRKDIYRTFAELLLYKRPLRNHVAYYAELLHTTPQNLNAVCRKETGQAAAEVLADCLVAEAKRLLAYTDNTVSEVALILSFKDPSHFVKYFKRHSGYTPKEFRETQR